MRRVLSLSQSALAVVAGPIGRIWVGVDAPPRLIEVNIDSAVVEDTRALDAAPTAIIYTTAGVWVAEGTHLSLVPADAQASLTPALKVGATPILALGSQDSDVMALSADGHVWRVEPTTADVESGAAGGPATAWVEDNASQLWVTVTKPPQLTVLDAQTFAPRNHVALPTAPAAVIFIGGTP